MPESIFELATSCGHRLDDRYRQMIEGTGAASPCDALRRHVEEFGRVSINVRAEHLLMILKQGRLKNHFELAAEEAPGLGLDVESCLRKRLGRWYGPRTEFEERFRGDRHFYYGALHIGGGGCGFGPFCLVTSRRVDEAEERMAFLKEDSLLGFRAATGDLDADAVEHGVATPGRAGKLAALKHQHEMIAQPKEKWASIVCRGSTYVEALMGDAPTVEQVERVCIPCETLRGIESSTRDSFDSPDLIPAHHQSKTHAEILNFLEERRIPIEEVE